MCMCEPQIPEYFQTCFIIFGYFTSPPSTSICKARAHAWHPSGSRCGPGNIGISVNHPRRMWSICGFYLLYPI